jgi:WD40 repeat protein
VGAGSAGSRRSGSSSKPARLETPTRPAPEVGPEERAGVGGTRATPSSFRFKAFISYSHAVDGTLAPAVQRGLHRFGKPWYRRYAVRTFRDETNLTNTPALWGSIVDALSTSEYFILLASPAAANSQWVRDEVEYWSEHGAKDHFLIALTDGTIAWDRSAGDFDWNRTTALPPTLRGVMGREPGYTDLTWARDVEHVSLRNPRFQDAIAELAVPLHGKRDKDEMVGEDIRQHRRTMRLARTVAVFLVVLALAATVSALLAVAQRNRAREERDIATSRQLAAQAVNLRDERVDLSLLLSLESLRTNPTVEAKASLLGSLERLPELVGLLHGSQGSAGAVTYSSDGDLIASGDGELVRLWDAGAGRETGEPLTGLRSDAVGLFFGADDATLTGVDEDGRVVVWDTSSRRPIEEPFDAHPGSVTGAAVSPDGELLALAGSEAGLIVWQLDDRQEIYRQPPSNGIEILSVAFDRDGTLAYGSELGGIVFVDPRTDFPVYPGILPSLGDFSQSVRALAFMPGGGRLASAGGGAGRIEIWRLRDGKHLTGFGLSDESGAVTAVAFDPSGSYFAAANTNREVGIWSTFDWKPLGEPMPAHGIARAIAFDPSSEAGTELASATDEGVVALWDAGRTMRLGTGIASGGFESVSALAFDPDGRVLASVTFGSLTMWDTSSRERIGRPLDVDGVSRRQEFVNGLSMTPDGERFAVAMSDGAVSVWSVDERVPTTDAPPSHEGHATTVAFDATGRLLASGGDDGSVFLWNVREHRASGEPFVTRPSSGVRSIAFRPGGDTLAIATVDGRIILWDVGTRQTTETLEGHDAEVTSVAFTPDGQTLASAGSDGSLLLWDIETGRVERVVVRSGDPVNDVSITPDGETLAAAIGNSVVLWDVDSGQQLGEALAGGQDQVVNVQFSPDGRFLGWGSFSIAPTDDLVVLWNASLSGWREAACRLANRNLTRDEWDRFIGTARPYAKTCPDIR